MFRVPEVGNTADTPNPPNPEVVGSNPTEVKFSLTRVDYPISFKGVITQGDWVYRQYCLLPAPKTY